MRRHPLRLGEVAKRLGGRRLEGDPELRIEGVAGLAEAGPGDLGFVRSVAQAEALAASRAGAVIAPEGVDVGGRPAIRSPQPSLDFARATAWILPAARPGPGVHASAQVDPGARLAEGVSVGALAVIGSGATIGRGSVVHAHVVIYPDVRIGEDCVLHAGAVVREDSVLGDRVVLQPGAVIGGDGFGFEFDEAGRFEKVPQVGNVVLEDDVEVGACTTIDRARLGTTRVRRGVKIDNLVQIGHNCEVGEDSAIVAQSGIAGSTRLGRRVFLMARAGVGGHLEIGDGSFLGARAGVTADLEPGSRVWGTPALPGRLWHRASVAFARLPELLRRVRALERRAGLERPTRGDD